MYRTKLTYALLTLALASYSAGCGSSGDSSLVHVQGTVRYQGREVPSGVMIMQSAHGSTRTIPIQRDGSYDVQLQEGNYRVGVVSSSSIPDEMDVWKKNVKFPPPVVPNRFGRPEESGIVLEISSSRTDPLDIEF